MQKGLDMRNTSGSGKIEENTNRGDFMKPIGPLMHEHRLIERMINVMRAKLPETEQTSSLDVGFIDTAVDFIRTYADRCHHGKEEGILFAALAGKDLTPEHRQTMEELIEDHRWARQTTASLLQAKNDYLLEKAGALEDLLLHLEALAVFYPRHIEKEDKHFFLPSMNYFSEAEKAQMLERMWEFDRKLIHETY